MLTAELTKSINECAENPRMIEDYLVANPLAATLVTEIFKVQEDRMRLQKQFFENQLRVQELI